VVIFHRWGNAGPKLERFVVVLNFAPEYRRVDVPFPVNGIWKDLLNPGGDLDVQGFWARDRVAHSNWGAVYFRAD
jgi:hypothetical protein